MSLVIDNLSFAYKKSDILKGVSLHAEYGELIALLGKNGAGKTTLFRCVLNFLSGYTGTIAIDGAATRGMKAKELARRVAYIPQSHSPTFNYTVFLVVLMGTSPSLSALNSPGEEQKERAAAALETLGIVHLADRGYAEISGGERQLVMIARALAQQSRVFIMDEPTANLDYGNQIRSLATIQELSRRGYLILLSTHNPEHALLYADRALVLQDGVISADGKPEAVLNASCLQRMYGIPVEVLPVTAARGPVRVCVPRGDSGAI